MGRCVREGGGEGCSSEGQGRLGNTAFQEGEKGQDKALDAAQGPDMSLLHPAQPLTS